MDRYVLRCVEGLGNGQDNAASGLCRFYGGCYQDPFFLSLLEARKSVSNSDRLYRDMQLLQ